MAEIVLEDVWKVYADGTEAVRALDLDIDDGEFMVLVGPVGVRQDDGAAHGRRAGGRSPRATDPHRRPRRQRRAAQGARHRDGVPELRALPAHDRLRQHGVRAEAAKMPKAEIDERVREAARILGLDELLDRKPTALSGGQRQRVAMGRAIVRHPQVFLMDEPLSNLDAKLRVQMRAEIARIQQRPRRHDDLRHPRPDRGDDDGRPRRGHPQGRCSSRSTPRRPSTSTRSTCSWPASSARRR